MIIDIDIGPIREEIAATDTGLVEVGTAKTLGAARADALTTPSAFVIPLAENAGPNIYQNSAGPLEQPVTFQFGVVLVVRDVAYRSGDPALSELSGIRRAVMPLLCRYHYPGAKDVCTPVRGALVSNIDRDGRMIWQDTYRIEFFRRIDP
ncbi:phage tail terminator protein [Tropicimonas sp. S265A]|uniref:phage tail terminator protein n=1 Tax=Tropicimonas sp. S265A TaxID=3415134 RepID=UPI003C7AFBA8